VASPATIDAVLREAGGFPMGPFQLTDLVGQDVNLAVSTSVWEQTYHDPRYAPTPFQRRLVDAGRLGRKTGRGVFTYTADGHALDADPQEAPPRPAPDSVELLEYDFGPMTPFLDRIAAGGVRVDQVEADDAEVLEELPGLRLPGGGLLRVTDGSTARSWSLEAPDGVVLLDWAHNPATCSRVALLAPRGIAPEVLDAAIGVCQAAGVAVSVVGDVAGGIVARTVAMLVDEAVDLVRARRGHGDRCRRGDDPRRGLPLGSTGVGRPGRRPARRLRPRRAQRRDAHRPLPDEPASRRGHLRGGEPA
jgi:3-hydroxybutyryl-CoA dehydrogenase